MDEVSTSRMGAFMMGLIYFSLGLIVGIVFFRIYIKYEKEKWEAKYKKESSIFQLVESSKDIIYYYEIKPEYKHKYTSPSVEHFLGEGILEELYNNPDTPFKIIHPDDQEIMSKKVSGDIDYSKGVIQRLRDKQGNYKWFEEYTTPLYENGELIAVQGIMRNIDEKVKLQKNLEYRIDHDALTDIYNRSFFEQNMGKYNDNINVPVAIILCDLDELKYLNDNYGHKKGDALIKESAKLLKRYFSENAIVSRIGGDEFAIIIINMDHTQVEFLCKALIEEIRKYNINSKDLKINISIGYAYGKHSIGEMEHLFTEADKNMYQDKREKKSRKTEVLC